MCFKLGCHILLFCITTQIATSITTFWKSQNIVYHVMIPCPEYNYPCQIYWFLKVLDYIYMYLSTDHSRYFKTRDVFSMLSGHIHNHYFTFTLTIWSKPRFESISLRNETFFCFNMFLLHCVKKKRKKKMVHNGQC